VEIGRLAIAIMATDAARNVFKNVTDNIGKIKRV
jgi:hypothetical protein